MRGHESSEEKNLSHYQGMESSEKLAERHADADWGVLGTNRNTWKDPHVQE